MASQSNTHLFTSTINFELHCRNEWSKHDYLNILCFWNFGIYRWPHSLAVFIDTPIGRLNFVILHSKLIDLILNFEILAPDSQCKRLKPTRTRLFNFEFMNTFGHRQQMASKQRYSARTCTTNSLKKNFESLQVGSVVRSLAYIRAVVRYLLYFQSITGQWLYLN